MTFFKSALSHLSHQSTPGVTTDMSLGSWSQQLPVQPTRFVKRVELCTALTTGQDAWGVPVEKTHRHTLLRVFVVPTYDSPGGSEEALLVERVLSTGGAYHSATPISETFSTGGSLFHPGVHDRMCVIHGGPSTAVAHHLKVDRTLTFGDGSQPHLSLSQLAQILDFVSRMTLLICAGEDCKFQSRSFAFTCLAALAPTLPCSRSMPKEKEGSDGRHEPNGTGDIMYELSAGVFLARVPWLVNDLASIRALRMIVALKGEPREGDMMGL